LIFVCWRETTQEIHNTPTQTMKEGGSIIVLDRTQLEELYTPSLISRPQFLEDFLEEEVESEKKAEEGSKEEEAKGEEKVETKGKGKGKREREEEVKETVKGKKQKMKEEGKKEFCGHPTKRQHLP